MKRLYILLIALLAFAATAAAQPRAVGLRLPGFGVFGSEFSYEHYIGDSNFLEVDLGVQRYTGFQATGTLNWELWNPDFTDRGNWTVYAGPGLAMGFVEYNRKHHVDFMIGITAQIGLEYQFWFPLALSVDIRPIVGACHGYYKYGNYGFIPNISARYYF